ncbi:hypothetical protein A9G28_07835 [Gilliamella sp. Fer1-1]|uniref:TetR/AcrR family transcriptional regulator n=1 Tax=Gilliamella sp. Fer1-1 TaxID=3120240 RepID=UPI00080E80DE|nr:TetR/AcrR family transcriptional regulator [Gilliamella apicola]OCG36575.1 hypothetical protein A9G29_12015 [Gilliamella apicola]OCG40587.1 hypothetical protein A9G28_07835 [Gilliamella apicola]
MKKTYKRIMETAEALFYRSGFANAGVDEIRDKSGCSKTTLYNNFGSKDKLILEVLKQRDLRFKAKLNEAIFNLNGTEAIMKIFEWHEKWYCEENFNGCLFIRAMEEIPEDSSCISDIVVEHKEFIRNLIFYKLENYPNKASLTNKLMVILEGLANISVVYKNKPNLHQQILQDTLNLVLELLNNALVFKKD